MIKQRGRSNTTSQAPYAEFWARIVCRTKIPAYQWAPHRCSKIKNNFSGFSLFSHFAAAAAHSWYYWYGTAEEQSALGHSYSHCTQDTTRINNSSCSNKVSKPSNLDFIPWAQTSLTHHAKVHFITYFRKCSRFDVTPHLDAEGALV